jgi:membrane-bound lytic murein transglycosylase MltF
MRNTPYILVVGLIIILTGCTPPSDDVLRRWNATTGQENGGTLSSFHGSVDSHASASQETASPVSGQFANATPLDVSTRKVILSFGPTIKRYSDWYRLDWRLVLATMKQESRFHPGAESHKGARGLMQIMPLTEEEIVARLDLESLDNPEDNIHGGVYYLRKLYDMYRGASEADRIRLALAAYNAGLGRISDAQELAAHLDMNPLLWESVKDVLPLLSRRHRDLHENVWEQEKPRSGWFGNSRETISYVEGVMNHYDAYRLALN